MLSIKDFRSLFEKETIEITRWDLLDYSIASKMFPKDKLVKAHVSLVELNDKQLDAYFFITKGVAWDDIRLFVWSLLQEDIGKFNQAIILIDVDLNKENLYQEPKTAIWRKFLIDLLSFINNVEQYDQKDIEWMKERVGP